MGRIAAAIRLTGIELANQTDDALRAKRKSPHAEATPLAAAMPGEFR
jgi:hypothetical protein